MSDQETEQSTFKESFEESKARGMEKPWEINPIVYYTLGTIPLAVKSLPSTLLCSGLGAATGLLSKTIPFVPDFSPVNGAIVAGSTVLAGCIGAAHARGHVMRSNKMSAYEGRDLLHIVAKPLSEEAQNVDLETRKRAYTYYFSGMGGGILGMAIGAGVSTTYLTIDSTDIEPKDAEELLIEEPEAASITVPVGDYDVPVTMVIDAPTTALA